MTKTSRTTNFRDQQNPRYHPIRGNLRIRGVAMLGAVISIALMVVGCGSSAPSVSAPQSPPSDPGLVKYELPDEIRYIERWIPTEILDLDSPDATFIRAFQESTRIAFFGGGAESAYPGFVQAMQPAIALDRYIGSGRDGYGVSYFKVVDFVELPGDQVRVTGCEASPSGHPNTPVADPNNAEGHGVASAFLLTYQRQGQSPPANQHGNQRAPSLSVFGNWHALEYIADYEFTNPEASARCIGQNYTDDPFTPSPGWPSSQPQV